MLKTMTKFTQAILCSTSLLLVALPTFAQIQVTLKEPSWQFILSNQPLVSKEAQIAMHERHFAKTIQPLLAAQNYQAVIQAFTERDSSNDSAALCQLRGQVQLMVKQYDDAEQSLLQAVKLHPNLALAHRSLSMAYMVKKSYKQAKEHLIKSVELGVVDAQIFGQLSYVNLQLGLAASAVTGYQNALFLEPNNRQWQQGLLYALINSHAFDQAQALLEEMLQSDMQSSELWLQRGQLALKQNRLFQAITSLEMALQLGDSNVENLATTAKLHIQTGSPRRAVNILTHNMPIFFDNKNTANVDVVEQISAWLVGEKKWPLLTDLLNTVDKNNQNLSKHEQAKFDVFHAQLALAHDNTEEAKKRLTRALDNDPSHGEALLSLASLLKSQQLNEKAVLYFVRAQAITEVKERALLGRAQLEIDRKKYPEALQLLREVLKDNPTRRDLLTNIQSLENIVRNQS